MIFYGGFMKGIFFVMFLTVFILLISSRVSATTTNDDYFPGDTWRTSSPEAQGMDSDLLYQVAETIEATEVSIHSFLVIRHGYLVEEAYFFPYHKNDRHQIHSCTKSFTSALVGIALDKGFLKDVNQKAADFFPEVTTTNLDDRKKVITIENLLTMTSGLDWPEWETSYASVENVINKMELSDNWVEYWLNRPMKDTPGTKWLYNSGGSHLLSAIVHRASKMDEKDFADQYLFKPLGITNYLWNMDKQQNLSGGHGLRLTPGDMAKLGYLYLKKGKWNGKQIVPESWVNASSGMHYNFDQIKWIKEGFRTSGYGYQFWLLPFGGYAAEGYDGQYIFVLPEQDMVVVFTSGLYSYDVNHSSIVPLEYVKSAVIPSVVSNQALPEKPESLSNHMKLLKKLERIAPKNYIWQLKD
jgi:CubicO group peptidase (beta-lactamase class C family)